jgi:hypothetical protein
MENEYRKQADLAEGNFFSVMSKLADNRLTVLCAEWRSQFPKSSLKIIFGMGSESVLVNGEHVTIWGTDGTNCRWDTSGIGDAMDLTIVADAIEDVWYICDGYRRACPNDIEVLPDDSELQGGPDGEKQPTGHRETGEDSDLERVVIPGYNCPRKRTPVDPVHIQSTGQRHGDRNSHEQRGVEL